MGNIVRTCLTKIRDRKRKISAFFLYQLIVNSVLGTLNIFFADSVLLKIYLVCGGRATGCSSEGKGLES